MKEKKFIVGSGSEIKVWHSKNDIKLDFRHSVTLEPRWGGTGRKSLKEIKKHLKWKLEIYEKACKEELAEFKAVLNKIEELESGQEDIEEFLKE